MKYICLRNPHDEEWKVFDYIEGKEQYAPTYGMAISSGATPEDAIDTANGLWGIDPDEVDVVE